MLGENIKILRKRKGCSQQTLADQLNVVRQTVSKWEKGISVPDAEMLCRISELFEVPVSELLGSRIPEREENPDIGEVASQLALLNEQLANQAARRRKTMKRIIRGIVITIAVIAVILAVLVVCRWTAISQYKNHRTLTTTQLECTLNGETYLYEITYDDQYRVVYEGGDGWISDHVQTEQYDDANVLIAQIEDYFTDRGGTCTTVDKGDEAE